MSICMYTVTDHPSDYPDKYAVRKLLITGSGIHVTEQVELFDTLQEVKVKMMSKGLVFIPRLPGDNPVIVGVWL